MSVRVSVCSGGVIFPRCAFNGSNSAAAMQLRFVRPSVFFSRLGKAAAAAAAAAAATCQACKARPELVSVSPSSLSFLLTICLAATKGGFRGSQVKGIWAHKKRGG